MTRASIKKEVADLKEFLDYCKSIPGALMVVSAGSPAGLTFVSCELAPP